MHCCDVEPNVAGVLGRQLAQVHVLQGQAHMHCVIAALLMPKTHAWYYCRNWCHMRIYFGASWCMDDLQCHDLNSPVHAAPLDIKQQT
jgi:hypothetical protein